MIFSCSRMMPSTSASGRGGQPGTWMSTATILSTPCRIGVVVEHPAGARAGAHRDHPLRLEHLVVDLAERRGHLVRDAAGDDQQVGLARRGAEDLHAEARDVVARRDDRHHLDRAAGEAERVGPDRLRPAPRRPPSRRCVSISLSSRSPSSCSNTPGPFPGHSTRSELQAVVGQPLLLLTATRALPCARCRRTRARGSR